jgi:hypothetical protein
LLTLPLALATSAHAHATYNLSGYGAGLAGSTNGADGSPTAEPPATWTNGGVAEYVGGLPVHWYAGMHSSTQIRTLQTGVAASPPSGSLAAQVSSYNDANDPDLPTDRVLAVGGKSWSDPDNANQGWGHGLDYGLIHLTPLDTILGSGPVKFTVTLMDDPSDGVSPRLAFALYGGWDTNPGSVRHQTFTTSPSPIDDPLGSTGLTLLDYAVASGAGQPVSRTFEVDTAYAGEYTMFVGALDGVAGQYQVTVALSPDAVLGECESDLAAAGADLATCEDDLATATADADADGTGDSADACAATPAGDEVDQAGCSLAQFCAGIDVATKAGAKACKKADWSNDEPVMGKKQADCAVDKVADLCVPAQ